MQFERSFATMVEQANLEHFMLAPLDNEVIFKKVFTNKFIFKNFVKDILDIEFEVGVIETEKKFSPKIGKIDFAYDIFAESADHRTIVEMQKIEYDYHFDRFLHYHSMAIAQLQTTAKEYKVDKTVYTIIILTAPYTISTKGGLPVKDEVLVSSVDPMDLQGQVKEIYGHKLIFLNPEHKNEQTPIRYRNWLDLIYESIHHPKHYQVNQQHPAVMKAVDLIVWDNLSPETLKAMKDAEGKKAALEYYRNQIIAQERVKLAQAKKNAREAQALAEQERQNAEHERQRADSAAKTASTEIALKLLDNHMSIQDVVAITGLSRQEVEALRPGLAR